MESKSFRQTNLKYNRTKTNTRSKSKTNDINLKKNNKGGSIKFNKDSVDNTIQY
jgi:hypothetical protein